MTIDEILEVLQAAKAGKAIQFRHKGDLHDDDWRDLGPIGPVTGWDFSHFEYRVKEECRQPRHIWVFVGSDASYFNTLREAKHWAVDNGWCRTEPTLFREVV